MGNYVVQECISAGGMCTVYRAEHPGLGRTVAIKVLSARLARDPEVSRRFAAEARVAAQLQHTNIIEIYDLGSLAGGIPYYVMEYLRGIDLQQHLLGQQLRSAVALEPHVRQICAALQVAHDHGVIHRDLGPANVLVLEGEETRLKLLDFGIARVAEAGPGNVTLTGELLGSPTFASPEQLDPRAGQVSPQTDLYALGVTLYWMLCGSVPFAAESPQALMMMHLKAPPPPLRRRAPDLPLPLIELVHACLAKDPRNRPASADQVAATYTEAVRIAETAGELGDYRRHQEVYESPGHGGETDLADIGPLDLAAPAAARPQGPAPAVAPPGLPPRQPAEPAAPPRRQYLSDLIPRPPPAPPGDQPPGDQPRGQQPQQPPGQQQRRFYLSDLEAARQQQPPPRQLVIPIPRVPDPPPAAAEPAAPQQPAQAPGPQPGSRRTARMPAAEPPAAESPAAGFEPSDTIPDNPLISCGDQLGDDDPEEGT